MNVARPLSLAVAIATVGTLPVFLVGALAVLIGTDLHLTATQIGAAATAFYATGAVSSVPAGRLGERWGGRRVSVIAGLLAVTSLVGLALAPAHFWFLLALMSVGGLANALAQTGANLLLSGGAAARSQGFAFGVKQSAVPLATMLGGIAIPVFGLTVGWRASFALFGALALLVSVLQLLDGVGQGHQEPQLRSGPGPRGLGERRFLLFAVAAGLAGAATNSMAAFLVTWSVEVGLSMGRAGTLMAVASVLAVCARVVSGVMADRRGGQHVLVVAIHITGGAVGMFLLSLGVAPLVVVGALMAYAIGWSWPGLLLMAAARLNPGAPGRSMSMIQTGAFTGGMSGPILFGLATDAWGGPIAWRLAGLSMAVSVTVLLYTRHAWRRRVARGAEEGPGLPGLAADAN